MTTGIIDKKRLIFPGLAGLYETFSPASYSFMRFATGAVLVPHGIQKIMLGSAVNLATNIDNANAFSLTRTWSRSKPLSTARRSVVALRSRFS